MATDEETKELINDAVDDLAGDLLYYGRRGTALHVGAIEDALKRGVVTVEEIVGWFKDALERNIP